jgi:hypothetical protein
MRPDSTVYYYITARQNSLEDIYAVLTPLSGTFDLYVSLERSYKGENEWELPSENHNLPYSK